VQGAGCRVQGDEPEAAVEETVERGLDAHLRQRDDARQQLLQPDAYGTYVTYVTPCTHERAPDGEREGHRASGRLCLSRSLLPLSRREGERANEEEPTSTSERDRAEQI
jgi:hypothetical protein